MRIILQLSPNKELVPFNYQQTLVGAFHKWIGPNELHDDISLYSLSWLHGGKMNKNKTGLNFGGGATFCISSPLEDLHKKAIDGIFKDQHIRWGMKVDQVILQAPPQFGAQHRFFLNSPVLVKRNVDGHQHQQYFYPGDQDVNTCLTDTLKRKLSRLNMSQEVSVSFDESFRPYKIKKTTFNNIDIKAAECPVIIKGDPEAIQFAWQVGVGHGTGIGFGCLR